MNYRSINNMNNIIRNNISRIPRDVDFVVGVPRSGMLPAAIIATQLNLPLLTIDQYINGNLDMIKVSYRIAKGSKTNRVLIVEDSCNTGNSIRIVRERLAAAGLDDNTHLFLCVFATSESKNYVDIALDICEQPRVFEWNIMNHYFIQMSCFDMDGVLCADPTEEQNDDGEKYIEFIKNARPLYIPKFKIGAIVTSRLEKYRGYTEEWLKNNGVSYQHLIMLDLPDKETRIKMGAHAPFKAQIYNSFVDAILFYESNDSQARCIAQLTNKPVYCVESNAMYFYNKDEAANTSVCYKYTEKEINNIIGQIDELFGTIDEGVAMIADNVICDAEEYDDVVNALIECVECIMNIYNKYNLVNRDTSLGNLASKICNKGEAVELSDVIEQMLKHDFRNSKLLLVKELKKLINSAE